jgi:triosephosphate isomerase
VTALRNVGGCIDQSDIDGALVGGAGLRTDQLADANRLAAGHA